MSGTITLSATLPPITSNLIITGPIAIDGNNTFQIMQINSGANVTLQSLTLTEGSAVGPAVTVGEGGAILNQGTLTISDCTLSNNQATGGVGSGSSGGGSGAGGGIFNQGGALTITNSTLSNNQATGGADGGLGGGPSFGGGIYNNNGATLTIAGSTLTCNQAIGGAGGVGAAGDSRGGAIYNLGTLTITNSTIACNDAFGGSGGSADGFGSGGALFNSGAATATITNATYWGNEAINGDGSDGVGGGIYDPGGTNLKGTILAASTGGNCGGTIPAARYSIADDNSCFTNGSNNNIVVTHTSDIGLASGLANNGGPTETIALEGGGMANALIAAPCTDQSSNPLSTDQRGFPRPAPSHVTSCSAGAFEYNPPFFNGEVSNGNQLYNLTFANSTFFGYYSYEFYPWLYQYDLGFEYVVDANDGASGVDLYDTSLGSYLYTNPNDFPYFWDYASSSWLYYYAETSRYFYEFGGMGRGYFFSPQG